MTLVPNPPVSEKLREAARAALRKWGDRGYTLNDAMVDDIVALLQRVDAEARSETWLAAFDVVREQYETGGDPMKRLARVDKTLGDLADESRAKLNAAKKEGG